MKRLKKCVWLCFVLSSCHEVNNQPNISAMVNDMADIECRAIKLREQRFALANEIRFAQDSIIHTANKSDTMRLHNKLGELNNQRDFLLQRSIALGDSIKHRLDSLFETHLTDTATKRKFAEALNETLVKRGCLEK